MSDYKSAFFVVPSRILELPNLTLQLLRFYETIFQFWNHGKICFLSNDLLMERCGMKSKSTIQEAFEYFEGHGEIKREFKGKKRYITNPNQRIELEDEPVDKYKKSKSEPLATASAITRHSETKTLATARHKNKKFNNKNINKSFYEIENKKKHDFAEKLESQREVRSTVKEIDENNPVYDIHASDWKERLSKKKQLISEMNLNYGPDQVSLAYLITLKSQGKLIIKDKSHGCESVKPGRNASISKSRSGGVRKAEEFISF